MPLPLHQLIDSRYVATRLLGSGGVAEIYEASDRYTRQDVALKINKNNDPIQIERLENEARFTSMFSHPHIIKILNVGYYEGQLFLSYELMKGKTMKDILDSRGKFPKEEIISMMKQILAATSHIHSRGILHNDIKPDNLFKFFDGNIKLLDFGIAMHIGDRQSGPVMASVKYAAPEVLQNKLYSIQSDIYSLGIVLYEFVTGKTPYERENGEKEIAAHINEKVPLTGTCFDDIIQRATDKNVLKRYKNDEDLLLDLDKIEKKMTKKSNFFRRLFGRHDR